MKTTRIYKHELYDHEWLMFGRDPEKPDNIIDSNQYMITVNGESILLDPGGISIFPQMLSSVVKQTELEKVKYLFASHQDPDIVSSLGYWDEVMPHAKLFAPWLWEGFISHYGATKIKYVPVGDRGDTITLGDRKLEIVPAHFLHASGNFHLYDSEAKILFSGDIGGSVENGQYPLFVDNFDEHIPRITKFHQRWMPSNQHKQRWIDLIRTYDIQIMAPQHGRLYKGGDVKKFIDWLEKTDVGILD